MADLTLDTRVRAVEKALSDLTAWVESLTKMQAETADLARAIGDLRAAVIDMDKRIADMKEDLAGLRRQFGIHNTSVHGIATPQSRPRRP